MDSVNNSIKLAIFDIAGTTAKDDGLVVEAFQRAMISLGVAQDSDELKAMTDYVNATMGQRKIDVFTHLCGGDKVRANSAHDRFIESYIQLVAEGKLVEFEGISTMFANLQESGIEVALTTGFPRKILDVILESTKWGALVEISVASDEVAFGRPAPDMIFRCIEMYNKRQEEHISQDQVAVIGDTESDMKSGVTSGARIVAGVATGAHNPELLFASGATHVLSGAVELPTIC